MASGGGRDFSFLIALIIVGIIVYFIYKSHALGYGHHGVFGTWRG